VFVGTAQNLSGGLVLAVSGPNGKQLKVEVVDKTGKISDFYLLLTGTKQNYTLTFTGDNIPSGFDATQIAVVNLVSTLATMDTAGAVIVETKGLNWVPPVTGSAYSQANLTSLPASPMLVAQGGATGGTITQVQTSPRDYSFNYTLADNDDFVFSQFGWGYFNTSGVFVGTAQNLSGGLVLAVSGPNGKQLKVEVVDKTGKISDFYLLLTGTKQNYTLTFTGDNIPSGFDATQIAVVNLVSTLATMGTAGAVIVETKGLDYAVPLDGQTYDATKHTSFYSTVVVSATGSKTLPGSQDGIAVLSQPSSSEFTVNYDVSPSADSFVFAQIDFGDGGLWMPDEFTFGLRGPAGLGAGQKAQVRLEVIDVNGKIAKFDLNVTNSLQNFTFSLVNSEMPSGFDIDHVRFMNLVMDQKKSSNHYVDSFQMKTQGLIYPIPVSGTAYDASALTDYYGTALLSAAGGKVKGTSSPGVVALNQTGPGEFIVNYDVSPSPDSFVFAQMNFGTAGLPMPSHLVFGVRGPSGLAAGQTAQVRVEVIDIWNNTVIFNLSVTNALQNFDLSFLGDGVPYYFRRQNVQYINFVMDEKLSNNHYADSFLVRSKGLIYQPAVDGAAYDAAVLTNFYGTAALSATGGKVNATSSAGIVALDQTSSGEFVVNYDVSPSPDSFVFSTLDFGSSGLPMPQHLIFGLRGPAGLAAGQKAQVKAEVIDIWGNRVSYYLNVTDALQNYDLSLVGDAVPAFFDKGHVQYINFVMDEKLSNNHYADSFLVRSKGLIYQPAVDGAAYDAAVLTNFYGTAALSAAGGKVKGTSSPGVVALNQTGSGEFVVNYDVSPSPDSFVFSTLDFGSSGLPMPQHLIFGLRGPAGLAAGQKAQVKAEVIDIWGNRVSYYLNVTDALQNYDLSLVGDAVPAFFDKGHVQYINFVMDEKLSNNHYADSFLVRSKGLIYQPAVDGAAYDAAVLTDFYSTAGVSASGGKVNPTSLPGIVTLNQTGSGEFIVNYDVSPSPDSFVFSTLDFGSSGLPMPQHLIFGLRGPAGLAAGQKAQVKAEVIDIWGNRVSYYLNVTNALQNYDLSLVGDAVPAFFDKGHVQYINFVMDEKLSNNHYADSFLVRSKGLIYIPTVNGTGYNGSLHTDLGGSATVSATGGKVEPLSLPGTVTLDQESSKEFTVNYNVTPSPDSFVFAQIDLGAGGMALAQNFIFGLRGPAGLATGETAQVKLEMIDIYNNRASFYLTVTNTAQNYTVSLVADGVPYYFNRNKVRFINFVVDQKTARNRLIDSFKVFTSGLYYVPPAG
jgi:hypothetical protein